MRFTVSLFSGLVLALVIIAATGGLIYASHDAGMPAGARIAAQAFDTDTPTPTPSDTPTDTTPSSTPSDTPSSTPTLTPTLRPIYFPSGPGDNSLNVESNGTQLEIDARVANLETDNSSNGAGIHHVDFSVYDAYGNLVDAHREYSFPYCYFQEDADGACKTWDFAQHNFQWPQGRRVSDGLYFVRSIWYNTQQTKLRIAEQAFWIELNGATQHPSLTIVQLGPDQEGQAGEYVHSLEFRTDLNFNAGPPITRMSLSILAPDGRVVYQHDDYDEPYCAFGDAGVNSTCNMWDFGVNHDTWFGGEPIQRTSYIFHAVAYSGNTIVAADARADPIRPNQDVTLPSGSGTLTPTATPTSFNSSSSNFVILADGTSDVAQVYGGLVFRTFAGDNGTDGDNVDHVDMGIYDGNGNLVHSRSETTARFCAFGGNESCNTLNFAGEGYRWSNGSAMQDGGVYTLVATVHFRNGKAPLTISRLVTIHF